LNRLPFELAVLRLSEFRPDLQFTNPMMIDFETEGADTLSLGKNSALAGSASFNYLETAIDWNLRGWVDAIVTGPINKLSLHAAGINYPGHTEILAAKTNTAEYCMMQYSEEISCAFVTTHVGYADVPQLITQEKIIYVIRLAAEALRAIRGREPVIVVCGLNPHAGEQGLFGAGEEESLIAPAIKSAVRNGYYVVGPLPPDTCFIPARRRQTDCYICMYHDQGHIPLKALAFDQAVNVTLGLPIIRTSVDHGTAFDIVGQNKADPTSLLRAISLAVKLAQAKRAQS
jgi:4-hydroxythreonine-4-phosphate dehydrogenase